MTAPGDAPSDSAAFFGDRAGRYDAAYDAASADGYALRSRLEQVLLQAGSGPGDALDVGMGPGRLCDALGRAGWTVSGVDAAEGMVDAAKQRLPEAAARLHVARSEALPFDDDSFDLVTATGVLEYSDVPRALDELTRVLRPGGRLVVSYPNPRAFYAVWKTRVFYPLVRAGKRLLRRPHPRLPRGAKTVTPARFRDLLEAHGIHVESVQPTSFLVVPSPLDSVVPRVADAVGTRLEEQRARGAHLLATQVVFAGRTPSTPPAN